MTPEIRYVTRCSYCHSETAGVYARMDNTRCTCMICGKPWTPEMVRITTEKVEVERD